MKEIKFQFSTTGSLLSHLIRWLTWSPYSHVDFVMEDGRLLGAQSDGVKIRPSDYEKFTKKDCITLEVTETQYDDFIGIMKNEIGKPYDFVALFGFIPRRDWASHNKWFCSEYGANGVNKSNIVHINTQLNRITPEVFRTILGVKAVSEECLL